MGFDANLASCLLRPLAMVLLPLAAILLPGLAAGKSFPLPPLPLDEVKQHGLILVAECIKLDIHPTTRPESFERTGMWPADDPRPPETYTIRLRPLKALLGTMPDNAELTVRSEMQPPGGERQRMDIWVRQLERGKTYVVTLLADKGGGYCLPTDREVTAGWSLNLHEVRGPDANRVRAIQVFLGRPELASGAWGKMPKETGFGLLFDTMIRSDIPDLQVLGLMWMHGAASAEPQKKELGDEIRRRFLDEKTTHPEVLAQADYRLAVDDKDYANSPKRIAWLTKLAFGSLAQPAEPAYHRTVAEAAGAAQWHAIYALANLPGRRAETIARVLEKVTSAKDEQGRMFPYTSYFWWPAWGQTDESSAKILALAIERVTDESRPARSAAAQFLAFDGVAEAVEKLGFSRQRIAARLEQASRMDPEAKFDGGDAGRALKRYIAASQPGD